MLRKNLLLLSLLVVGVLFTGCPKEAEEPAPAPWPEVSFNISDAEALGGRESTSARSASGARDAEDNSNGSVLVKIMEDGTLESALSFQLSDIESMTEEEELEMTNYSKLTDIFLPPKDSGCSDVYLLFDDKTNFPAQNKKNPHYIEYWCISRLVCIHDDNSWTDILYDDPINGQICPIESKKNIQISSDGSLYVLFAEGGGWEYYIRKYDPKTKRATQICKFGIAAPTLEELASWTEEDWDNSFVRPSALKISKDGKWAYIEVIEHEKNYIHVLSTENPDVFKDIDLGDGGISWDYDEESNQLYYVRETRAGKEIPEKKLYKADYKGENETLLTVINLENSDIIYFCDELIVVAKDTIWIKSNYIDGLSFHELKINNNQATDQGEKKFVQIPQNAGNYQNYYIIRDNAAYFWYAFDADYESTHKNYDNWYFKSNDIIRVPFTDDPAVLYRNIIPEQNNIIMSSWNVGNEKLYITGWDHDDKPVNYAINLDGTGEAEPVAEGQVFTCIGSLK